jgi:UDP-2,3-diacylglucosamine pyrophosphatase LpxH
MTSDEKPLAQEIRNIDWSACADLPKGWYVMGDVSFRFVGKDVWVCAPPKATAEYMQKLAETITSAFSAQKVYFEFGNEDLSYLF